MKNKKIILIIIFLLFSTSVLAQNFNIRIIEYEPEIGNARLKIENIGTTDFHDIKLKVDNNPEIYIAEFFRAETSFATFVTIFPGQHDITLITKEGTTTTKSLYFSPNEEQLKEIIAANKKISEQQRIQPIQKTPVEKIKFIYIVIALIIAFIIYLIYRKKQHTNNFKK